MEKQLSLNWVINNNEINYEYRYCHNCGKKVIFKDSLKRRQNANGKSIFHFAIYKCEKGHTWNKTISRFKSVAGLENIHEQHTEKNSRYEVLNVLDLKNQEIEKIDIILDAMDQKVRLDKFLASKVEDMSRNKIIKLIESGFIKVNGETVQSKLKIKELDKITIDLNKKWMEI